MEQIKNFWELEAWKKANVLAIEIYILTKNFPLEEKYGMISQLRRAATSVAANIAEGFSRYHYKDKIKFYYNGRGSASEVQSFIIFCKDIGFVDAKRALEIVGKYNEELRLLNGLINSISKQISKESGTSNR